jgi:glycine oxidase
MRVTIVGAGIIGLSLAWELSRRGVQVRVLDRGQAGKETSWAGVGILPAARLDAATDPLERLRGLSHELYPKWTEQLLQSTGLDSGLRRSGGLYLASTPGEAASLMASVAYQQDLGLDVTLLSPEDLIREEKNLAAWAQSSQFRAAALSPDEWQIRTPLHLAALIADCQNHGVSIEENAAAQLVMCGERAEFSIAGATASTTNDDDRICVCGGAWSGQFAAEVGLGQSVIPIRGQVVMYHLPEPPIKRIVNEGHRYLVPREDGHLLVGSCEEEVGFQKGTTPEMLESLQQWAESIIPALQGIKPAKSWSGLRPGTFDGFPMIGKVPEVSNLYVASGHYRSGIHLAPATAVVLADMMCDQKPAVDVAAFRVGRMISR